MPSLFSMKSIYIGVCKTRDYKRFKESFHNFINEISSHYSVCIRKVVDTFLPDAQNEIAKAFLDNNYDYLLLLDDDHWGHTKEMLDILVNANAYVATIHTYSRHYPYSSAILDKVGHNAVVPVEHAEGYRECDMTGFPMTLIRRDLFEKLEEPYFRPVEAEGRNWNTDIDFFERLGKMGIKPVGCFQHTLAHDKITKKNVWEYRHKERLENNNIAWYNILRQKQLQGA